MERLKIKELLEAEDWAHALARLRANAGRSLATRLLAALYDDDLKRRWRAAEGLGAVVAQMAQTEGDSAREVIRRLLWSLNEESGSIGWGAPEAIAEILRQSSSLRSEFLTVFLGHLDPRRWNRMDPGIRVGFLWGLWRLIEEPLGGILGCECTPALAKSLKEGEGQEKAWAAIVAKALGLKELDQEILQMQTQKDPLPFYSKGKLIYIPVGDAIGEIIPKEG